MYPYLSFRSQLHNTQEETAISSVLNKLEVNIGKLKHSGEEQFHRMLSIQSTYATIASWSDITQPFIVPVVYLNVILKDLGYRSTSHEPEQFPTTYPLKREVEYLKKKCNT